MIQIVSQFALPKALATCFAAWSIFLAATAQSGQADQSESSAIEEVVAHGTVKKFQRALQNRAKDVTNDGCSISDLCDLRWIRYRY